MQERLYKEKCGPNSLRLIRLGVEMMQAILLAQEPW